MSRLDGGLTKIKVGGEYYQYQCWMGSLTNVKVGLGV